MNKPFHKFIPNYFIEYLPNECGLSKNTITSYKYSMSIFLKYLQTEKQININKIEIQSIDRDLVLSFLKYLEVTKLNSVSTQTLRLKALCSFCKYLQLKEITYIENYSEIKNITLTKIHHEITEYLTKEEFKEILNSINTTNKKGLRDYVLISLLYDSGARVSEVINLKLSNIDLDSKILRLLGKGNKTRTNPIAVQVVNNLRKYILLYSLSTKSDENLFFNSRCEKLTKEGVKYIVQKYIPKSIQKNITPHSLRHSKAMHMLENGINLIYIRDFLGHNSVTTTERYARANPELRRKAIEDLSNELIGNTCINKQEEDLLEWLKCLN